MSKIGEAIEGAREAANTMTPSAEGVKAAAKNTIHRCTERLKGENSVTKEVVTLASTCAKLPLEAAENALKAGAQLCTLQPVKASCTVAKGLTATCKNMAAIAAAPVSLTAATAKSSVRTAKKGAHATAAAVKAIATLPVTVPLKAYNMAGNGITKLENILGVGDTPSVAEPANDNAKAAADSSTPIAA